MFSLMSQIYKVMLKGLLKIMPYLFAFSSIYSVILLIQENAPVSDIVVAILLMIVVNYFVWRRFGNRFRRENYDEMTGEEFEDFCVSLLKANGFYNVSKTKSSGDHGIDVLATKNGKRYAIQCKRYSNNIGNKAVQEAYSGKDIYGADIAVVMTNQYFTRQAANDASALNVQLWDRNKLVQLINTANNKGKIINPLKNFKIKKNKVNEKNVETIDYNQDDSTKLECDAEGSVRIINPSKRRIAIEDGDVSKYLYQYLELKSREYIYMYFQNGDENSNYQEMIQCVQQPLVFYNATYIDDLNTIGYLYYCRINSDFKNTNVYKIINKNSNEVFDAFEIEVYYNVDKIIIKEEIIIDEVPEVSIMASNMETIIQLNEMKDREECGKYLLSENFFPIVIDNFNIRE